MSLAFNPQEPIKPEYKSWPLEKLQNEYFRTNLRRISAEMALHDLETKFRLVEQFLDALTAVTGLAATDREASDV